MREEENFGVTWHVLNWKPGYKRLESVVPAFPLLGFRIIRCQEDDLFLQEDGVNPRERQSVGFFISAVVMLMYI